jgi:hypothetical protein
MNKMIIYRGFLRTTEVEQDVEDMGCGAGRTKCIECEGTGWWGYGPTEKECGPCVECKGTGYILVSI